MNDLSAFLDYRTEVWGLIFPEVILYLVAAFLVFSILRSTYRAFHPKKAPTQITLDHELEHATCANCGWEGELSRLHRVCPKCGQSNFVE